MSKPATQTISAPLTTKENGMGTASLLIVAITLIVALRETRK